MHEFTEEKMKGESKEAGEGKRETEIERLVFP